MSFFQATSINIKGLRQFAKDILSPGISSFAGASSFRRRFRLLSSREIVLYNNYSTNTTIKPKTQLKALSLSNTSEKLPSQHLPKNFSDSTKEAINKLRDQLRYYAIVDIRSQKFLITKNDIVIAHRLRDVNVGDELRLNRVLELGSKDYTIKGQPLVSEAFYNIKATVLEQPKGPFIQIFKKKPRNRHRKRITHKQTYTVLRISEIDINKFE